MLKSFNKNKTHFFYSLLFSLAIPLIVLRLLWRSIKASEYRKRWSERLGYYNNPIIPGVIWIHAVSVGEAEAVFPLIKRLLQNIPHAKILVTTTTPTGSARVQAVMGNSVQHVYLPYDTPAIVNRFMRAFKPVLAVVMETELWPNLFNYCGITNIPLYVINARLSEKSARGYCKLPGLVKPLLANIKQIAAQSQGDADRFISIGANPEQVVVAGNIKFDIEIAEEIIHTGKQLKLELFKGRFVWLAASTHQGEEQILLEIYQDIKKAIPNLLLIIVPRHPERFLEVSDLIAKNKLVGITRTSNKPCTAGIDIYVADTMGELKMLYAAADVAFVGGSMVSVGGHNILEPAVIGIPVLFGPYMANFKEITQKVLTHKAAIQCADSKAVVREIQRLYADSDYRNTLIANGADFVRQNRGAIDKLYTLLVVELRN
jgi:3-deoxy-D-manno-octulosonic-acid transferase